MARRAFLCAHRTRRDITSLTLRVSRFSEMTRETLRIVISRVFLQLLVRIVTGQTAYARIVAVMPAAIEHTVRLKSNVVD